MSLHVDIRRSQDFFGGVRQLTVGLYVGWLATKYKPGTQSLLARETQNRLKKSEHFRVAFQVHFDIYWIGTDLMQCDDFSDLVCGVCVFVWQWGERGKGYMLRLLLQALLGQTALWAAEQMNGWSDPETEEWGPSVDLKHISCLSHTCMHTWHARIHNRPETSTHLAGTDTHFWFVCGEPCCIFFCLKEW